jgi:hypothetical protein
MSHPALLVIALGAAAEVAARVERIFDGIADSVLATDTYNMYFTQCSSAPYP